MTAFAWEGEHLAIDLPGAHVVFTTRRGGVSAGPYASLNLGWLTDDDPAAITENRARVQALTPGTLANGRQVHGTEVRRVTEPTTERAEADGQATVREDVAPLVLIADCLPIALAAPGGVAMLHGGWRGLAGGIVAEGVRALAELGAGAPVAAAIGPGAGGCCYEVGEEVHAHFAGHGGTRSPQRAQPRPQGRGPARARRRRRPRRARQRDLHAVRGPRAVVLAPPRRRRHRAPGRRGLEDRLMAPDPRPGATRSPSSTPTACARTSPRSARRSPPRPRAPAATPPAWRS